MTQDLPLLLKGPQAMALLGVRKRETWRKLIDAGTVKPLRLAGLGRPVYRRDDILKLCK